MQKPTFFVDASKLEYVFSDKEIANRFDEEASYFELPSVSYLSLRYENEIYFPVAIFQSSLTPFQAMVKYLKEQVKLSNSIISSLLRRDVKTIWATYNSVKNKKTIQLKENGLMMPLSSFHEKKFSIFESVVQHLKNQNFTYAEIGRLINKDQRTIWTVYSRLKKKISNENHE
jgi:hypothetical protein